MPPVGVILAGGASGRFGGAKGLQRVGGVRIIDRVVAALSAVAPDLLLVANAGDAGTWLPEAPLVADMIQGGGGLSGVHAALSHSGRAVVVVALDMPFVSPALLRKLVTRGSGRLAEASVPQSASPVGMEPFCAWYAAASLTPLDRALRAGEFGAARFIRGLTRVEWLPETDASAFGDPARLYFSVNTRDDLARAEAMASIPG